MALNEFIISGAQIHFNNFLKPSSHLPLAMANIGAGAGHCSAWLMENVLLHKDSILYDVDTWNGWDPQVIPIDYEHIESAYDANLTVHRDKLLKFKMHSNSFWQHTKEEQFDFIYLNGSRHGLQVAEDMANAFHSLKEGGIMAIAAYTYGPHLSSWERPKEAVDSALKLLGTQIDVFEKSSQVWCVKNGW